MTTLPRKRATPRTRKCSACSARISTAVCPECKTRKATKRGNIGKRCDALWAAYVKRKGICQRCYTTQGIQAAHIIGRAQRVVRWSLNPPNGIALCHRCHREFDTYRFDREWFIEGLIGADAYLALKLKAQGVWDKQYPLAELSARLKEVTAGSIAKERGVK